MMDRTKFVVTQPIPLTINGPSLVAIGSGSLFQAATMRRNFGLSGFNQAQWRLRLRETDKSAASARIPNYV